MARVLCRAQVSYLPGLQVLVHRVCAARASSAAGPSGPSGSDVAIHPSSMGLQTVWPDESMGPFGPQDQRFLLPGNVGFVCQLEGLAEQRKGPAHRGVPDLLSSMSSIERHDFILAQCIGEFSVSVLLLTLELSLHSTLLVT
ncbi:methylmalonic aciduria and homocystinuria type D homolog, mitochondrial-like [Notothenia coriiceps]|uniref:Methylmalonic aciduria and homocystinuria type D homolog, mitochondrial-like n=1 Tax=Notothenia coriiceps TaxID=8208 RepID=A0A6I9NT33_9TELE|nr:PREDICTED: methylmalonic aciduria and homocystinuria type D homolog, mitochondrial-like [Notothenia coriiceps]XP_010779347.1 PREDICTED: methylmalonic aciduria and homocystinuria type D homolog, mitochondrial-like [Notothenia coriiceps]XP_010779348.1 PREDICTED: methylmalonic aciduria and homocystinuria type D homolog, mitochondrial-like [Notothenia coriiceps]